MWARRLSESGRGGGTGFGQEKRTQSQKVNKNHNSDNFIYNTLEELYFIYSFKCDDEAAESSRVELSRVSTRNWAAYENGQADRNPGTCPPVSGMLLFIPPPIVVASQLRVEPGLETLLRFGSRCVYKLWKSVCILTYENHVVPLQTGSVLGGGEWVG